MKHVQPSAIQAFGHWHAVGKFNVDAAALADRHYSRRKIGSPQFMPPGQTLVLLSSMHDAVFGWWRPHPRSGIKQMNNLDGWTCTIFRNESTLLSSYLILEAEAHLWAQHFCGPHGMLTYVWDSKVRSTLNPGCCFKMAGWLAVGRSADDRKTLFWKPFELAGVRACGFKSQYQAATGLQPPGTSGPERAIIGALNFSSGDGPGIHQPGSNTRGFASARQPASGRAAEAAMCPAVARSFQGRAM